MNKKQILALVIILSLTIIIGILVGFELLPTSSITIFSLIMGVGLLIFIRKFKQENEKELAERPDKISSNASSKSQYLIGTTRLFSILSAFLTIVILGDIFLPAGTTDIAAVISKNESSSKYGTAFYINAKGNYNYRENVSEDFYKLASAGDKIKVYLSKNFMEWKSVELIKNDRIVAISNGSDIYYLGIFGIAFLIPLFSFSDPQKWLKNFYYWIPSVILILLSLVLLIFLNLKWFGIIEKF